MNNVEELRIAIKLDGVEKVKQQLEGLKAKLESIDKGSSAIGVKNMFSDLEASAKVYKKVLNDLEKDVAQLKKAIGGDISWNALLKSPDGKNLDVKTMNADLIKMRQTYQEIIDTLSLKEKYTAAEASEIRQQTTDLGIQEEILNRIGSSKYSELLATEEIEDNTKKQVVNLSDYSAKLEKISNSTKKIADDTKKAADNTSRWDRSNAGLIKRMIKFRLIRMVLAQIVQDLGECIKLLVVFDKDYNNNMLGYNQTLSDITSAFKRLSASLSACGIQLLQVFGPVLNVIINALTTVVNMFSAIIAMFGGKTTYTVANPNYWQDYADSIKESSSAAKELKNQLASFDELNILSEQSTGSSGYSIGGISPDDMYVTKELPEAMKKVAGWMEKIREVIKKIDEWLRKIFGDTGANIIETLGLAALVLGLKNVWNWIKKLVSGNKLKNSVMTTETDLAYQEAYAYNWALIPAFGLAYEAIKSLFDKQNEWQKQTSPALGSIVMAWEWCVGKVKNAIDWCKTKIGELTSWCQEHSGLITGIITALVVAIGGLVLATFFPEITAGIAAALSGIVGLFSSFSQTVYADDGELHDNLNTQTENGLENTKLKWTTKLAAIIATIIAFRVKAGDAIGSLMENLSTNFGEGLNALSTSISNFFEKAGSKFSEWGTNLGTYFTDLWNSIGSTITSGVNSAIDKLNGLVTAYKKAKAEDYASQVSAWQNKVNTAKALGLTTAIAFVYTAFRKIKLPGISSLVPGFANGGVISSPTLGLVGEYPGARTNPEIITPENKMREVFAESNGELAVLIDRNNKLLEALLNKDNSVVIGDDIISASAARGAINYKRRTGKSQFSL